MFALGKEFVLFSEQTVVRVLSAKESLSSGSTAVDILYSNSMVSCSIDEFQTVYLDIHLLSSVAVTRPQKIID